MWSPRWDNVYRKGHYLNKPDKGPQGDVKY